MIIQSRIPRKIIFVGDSMTDNNYLVPSVSAVYWGRGSKMPFYKFGVSGGTIKDAITKSSEWLSTLKPNDIVCGFMGTNDNTLDGDSANTIFGNLTTFANSVTSRQALFIYTTMIARGSDATKETVRITFNGLVSSNPQLFTAIVPFGDDPHYNTLAGTADTIWYDGARVHPTIAGDDRYTGNYLIPTMDSVMQQYR